MCVRVSVCACVSVLCLCVIERESVCVCVCVCVCGFNRLANRCGKSLLFEAHTDHDDGERERHTELHVHRRLFSHLCRRLYNIQHVINQLECNPKMSSVFTSTLFGGVITSARQNGYRVTTPRQKRSRLRDGGVACTQGCESVPCKWRRVGVDERNDTCKYTDQYMIIYEAS